jgi:hypothetical protein
MKCISPFLKMQRVFSSLPSAAGDFSTPGMGYLQAENQLKRDLRSLAATFVPFSAHLKLKP